MDSDHRKHGLAPLVGTNPRVLILGTMPGEESLQSGRYYAHARNSFWPTIAAALGERPSDDYQKNVAMIHQHGIALWDVLREGDRKGSLDSEIRFEIANDFASFLATYSAITKIGFNGGRAYQFFRRHVLKDITSQIRRMQIAALPSTSPTPGRYVLPQNERAIRWREFINS